MAGRTMTVAAEEFEDPGRPSQRGDFEVRRLLGVWKPEHYLCRRCGQVYDYGKIAGPELQCTGCGFQQPFDPKMPLSSTATIYERVKPPWWSADAEAEWEPDMEQGEVTEHPEIDQECPSCGNSRLQFWTRQLRSADEGLSVFFLCKKCGWRTVEK
ncbi:unnamed protein product [Effrenium voratum]|nr:unnamed protein product [Effrenium voratum]CAJ1435448.1 unnamed protein product [Effrenium voratum]